MVKGNLTMVKGLGKVAGDELGLETWIPHMGPFPLVDELRIILACSTLIFSFQKGRHAGHLQWDSMRKSPMAWANIYGAVSLGMGDMIYSRGGRILTSTACPTRGTWFGKFMRGSKLRMGVIKNKYFGIA